MTSRAVEASPADPFALIMDRIPDSALLGRSASQFAGRRRYYLLLIAVGVALIVVALLV